MPAGLPPRLGVGRFLENGPPSVAFAGEVDECGAVGEGVEVGFHATC